MSLDPTVRLNDGHALPRIGFGTWQISDDDAPRVVADALAAGYRMIDTATVYGNERGVGEALRRSDVPRDAITLTTKVWNSDQGEAATMKACEASLDRLGLERIDLYLIHWPAPARGLFRETWKALGRLREEGRVRSIGVSNFRAGDLEAIIGDTGIVPAVNQIELHPRLRQAALSALHARHGIVTEAWSPIGKGAFLDDPTLVDIARERGCTSAQAVLRWQLDAGNVVIPRSGNAGRLRENLASAAVSLTDEDRSRIDALDRGERTGPDPDTFS